MLQVENKTPFVASLSLFPDEAGIDTVYPILKATFLIGDGVRLADDQLPLISADEYSGEPGQSGILHGAEFTAAKPATDVLMIGHAYAPSECPAARVDVSLRVNGQGKTVRVFGDREWKSGFFGESISNPIPFERMELTYERAFGGSDITKKGEPASFDYNSIGRGFRHQKGTQRIEGMPLPNLEDPYNLIKRSVNRPKPACFAPICPNWLPRLQYAGTYDEAWQKERAPFLPDDFDPRFYNVAAPELIFEPYLKGGEQVDIENATPEGRLQFRLPRIEYDVKLRIEGDDQIVPLNLDTVCIEPDELRLTMIWRGKCYCDKKMLKMELATFRISNADHGVKGLE
jgi:hypothetical protein